MRALALAIGFLASFIGAAAAADRPVVVELYTSQGCSSCPPADAILAELADREDVIALAFHVDYWDYIGWKDIFADPANTLRQRNYARVAGARSVYTPQMIVDGQDHVVGTKPMKLAEHIDSHRNRETPVTLKLTRDGDLVRIRARSDARLSGGSTVRVATYSPEETVAIKRGENAGRTLTYHNVVRGLTDVSSWDGAGEFRANVKIAEGAPVVVLIQEGHHGPMLAAARLR